MSVEHLLGRITVNQEVMVGKPVISGTRLTVEYIVGLLAQGERYRRCLKNIRVYSLTTFGLACFSQRNLCQVHLFCPCQWR